MRVCATILNFSYKSVSPGASDVMLICFQAAQAQKVPHLLPQVVDDVLCWRLGLRRGSEG